MAKEAITPRFRASYPNLFTAKLNELNGKEEYSVVALFDDTSDLKELHRIVAEAIAEKWGTDKKKHPANLRLPFRDQGTRAKDVDGKKVLPAGYKEGHVFVTLKSNKAPAILDQSGKTRITDESAIYPGCYLRASVRAAAYDMKGNKGVSIYLGNIQKMADGELLMTRTAPEEEFGAVEVDDTNQMFS